MRTGRDGWGRPLAAGLLALVAMGAAAGTAQASTCNDTWHGGTGYWDVAGNWSGGVPSSASDVCIDSGAATIRDPGGYTLGSLEIGSGASLTVTIGAVLTPSATTVSSGGSLVLNGTYEGANAGNAALDGGTVDNLGTITMEGTGYSATLAGTVVNQGTIDVPFGQVAFGTGSNGGAGSLDNQGVIDIVPSGAAAATAPPIVDATSFPITDDAGGSIVNQGQFNVGSQNGVAGGYTQGAGTETGNAVQIYADSPLSYTGAGASSIEVHDSLTMTGNLSAGQNLQTDIGTIITEPGSFTNAGAITLNGNYYGGGGGPAGIAVSSGTFTNDGTLLAESNDNGPTLSGAVVNAGQIAVTPGTTLELTSGSLANAASGTVVSQISSTGFGNLQIDGGAAFSAGGTMTPSLQGGFVPTTGQSFGVVGLRGGSSSGTFSATAPGWYATYSSSTGVGLVYGQSPSTATPEHRCLAGVRRIAGGEGTVEVALRCSRGALRATSWSARVVVVERVRHGHRTVRRTVTIASAHGSLRAGHATTARLKLDRAGRALLAHHRSVRATVIVTSAGHTHRKAVTITRPAKKRRG